MPIVQIEILQGRTSEQKRQMVKEVTEAIARNLNCSQQAVSIIIREMPRELYATGGVLYSDKG